MGINMNKELITDKEFNLLKEDILKYEILLKKRLEWIKQFKEELI
jgi:CRISPR/Cas system CMR-associated protein Cmr1 (group 7 of RAMP superfamily)